MQILLQTIISGLLLGGIYALFSVGLTLIFGVMDLINFAHGEYLMLSMYTSFFLWQIFGLDLYFSIFIIIPLFFIFGVFTEKVFIRPIIDKPIFIRIVVTLGLSIILRNLAHTFFTSNVRRVGAWYCYKALQLGFLSLTWGRIIAFAIAVVVMMILHLFLKTTKVGMAIRATSQDKEAAMAVGIDIQNIYAITFGIGIALTGIAGSCLAAILSVQPEVGVSFALIAFVVTVLGGLGNIQGALFGALFIGVIQSLAGVYVHPTLAAPVYYVLFILVLLLRATGHLDLISRKLQHLSRAGEKYEIP
jgi:branched-chain amino acid transport system permease protein